MKFPPTKLDLHNEKVRAGQASTFVPDPALAKVAHTVPADSPGHDLHVYAATPVERIAMLAAHELEGVTIFFGGSENAAAEALGRLKGYQATLNLTQHVWIDRVYYSEGWFMQGVRSDPASGARREDQRYEISLNEIKSIAV